MGGSGHGGYCFRERGRLCVPIPHGGQTRKKKRRQTMVISSQILCVWALSLGLALIAGMILERWLEG